MKTENLTPAEALAAASQIWASGIKISPSRGSAPRKVTAPAEVFNAVWEVLLRACDHTAARANAVAGQLTVPGFPTRVTEAIKGAALIQQHTSGGSWEHHFAGVRVSAPNKYGFDKQGNPTAAVCLRLTEVTLDHKAAIRVIEFNRRQADGKGSVCYWKLQLRKLSTNRALAEPMAVAVTADHPTYYS